MYYFNLVNDDGGRMNVSYLNLTFKYIPLFLSSMFCMNKNYICSEHNKRVFSSRLMLVCCETAPLVSPSRTEGETKFCINIFC